MNPNAPCVFCDPVKHVDDWGRTDTMYVGYPIYWVKPINPVVPGHTLIVPKMHIASADQNPKMFGVVMQAAAKYAQGLVDAKEWDAYNIIQSNGADATQTVSHLHVHLVPRRDGDGLKLPWSE